MPYGCPTSLLCTRLTPRIWCETPQLATQNIVQGNSPRHTAAYVQAVLPVLAMTIHEIVRLMSSHSRRQGQLLGRVWRSFSTLFDMMMGEMTDALLQQRRANARLEQVGHAGCAALCAATLTTVLRRSQRLETMEAALAGTEAEQKQAVHLMTRKIERAWAAKLRVLKVSGRVQSKRWCGQTLTRCGSVSAPIGRHEAAAGAQGHHVG